MRGFFFAQSRLFGHDGKHCEAPIWRQDSRWWTEQFGPLQFSVSQFSDAERMELGALPPNHRLPEAPDVLFYHANPRNDMDIIRSWTTDENVARNFAGVDGEVFVGGHTHTQYIREWRGRRIVVCGSVGATNDHSAGAQYVLLEGSGGAWRIEHRDVAYDVKQTLRRFEETNYLQKTGPIGRLFVRGVATSTNQLMPFLKWYKTEARNVELSKAVDRFLNLY